MKEGEITNWLKQILHNETSFRPFFSCAGFAVGEDSETNRIVFKFKQPIDQNISATLGAYGFSRYEGAQETWGIEATPENRRIVTDTLANKFARTLGRTVR